MDIVLIGPDLVRPRPFVEVGGGSKLIEAAVPENIAWRLSGNCRCQRIGTGEGTCRHCADQHIQDHSLAKHHEEVGSVLACGFR